MSNSQKKVFVEPELFVHGKIEEITEQNANILVTDVPQGTQADPGLPGLGVIGS